MMMRSLGVAVTVGVAACSQTSRESRESRATQTPAPARLELDSVAPRELHRADSLELRASTVLEDSVLTLSITIVNHSRRTRQLSWAPCSMNPQLRRDQSLEGRPAYDWERRPNPDPETGRRSFCPTSRIDKELAPGDSVDPREFIQGVLVRRIAGDSLVAGRYFVTADVRLSVDGPGHAERIIVPAGSVQLLR